MSLILELHHCRIHRHWIDIGSKRRQFGAFWRFSAKGRKVIPITKTQLVVNSGFRASTSQQEVPEASHKRILEVCSKVNFGQFEGRGQSQSQVNLVAHSQRSPKSAKSILDTMRSPLAYSFFLPL